MGSFNYTCSISHLPIGYNDEVRFFLIAENNRDGDLHIDSKWLLRTPPIKAKYSDYGSIEGFDENYITSRVMFQGLDQDVIEKCLGYNECHDCPVTKGMSVDGWLDAFVEGRVRVKPIRNFDFGKQSIYYTIPKGVPTITRLRKMFPGKKYGESDISFQSWVSQSRNKLKVDIRKNKDQVLKRLQEKYSCVEDKHGLTLSSKDPNVIFPSRRGSSTIKVAPMMVREDVYQAVLNFKFDSIDQKYHIKFKDHVESYIKTLKNPPKDLSHYQEIAESCGLTSCEDLWNLSSSTIDQYLGVGISQTFNLKNALKLAVQISEDQNELDQFVSDWYQTWDFQNKAQMLRCKFFPSSSVGPQFGEWEEHQKFHQTIVNICQQKVAEYQNDEEE